MLLLICLVCLACISLRCYHIKNTKTNKHAKKNTQKTDFNLNTRSNAVIPAVILEYRQRRCSRW